MSGGDTFETSVLRSWGPQTVPRIECGKCETEHHIDAADGEFIGHCRECWAFLRRPTEKERRRFTDFIAWKSAWMDAELSEGSA